jgi:hypothetical protein
VCRWLTWPVKTLGDVMNDPFRPPQWRARTKLTGPVSGDYDTPRWILALERAVPPIVTAIVAILILLTAYAWGADALLGHL